MNVNEIGNKCTGCNSCVQLCPVKAISFKENDEGFFYPFIGQNCIECEKCIHGCHVYNELNTASPLNSYAAYIKNNNILQHSTSGGVFAALANNTLKDSGVVFGCAEPAPGVVEHLVIHNENQINIMQGSKYVESNMDGIYSCVLNMLKEGTQILFSGTPCQIAGLKTFLQKEYDNLFTVDIVCHGVPSRKLYNSYLNWESIKNRGEIVNFDFRSKKKHGWSLTYKICYMRGKKIYTKEHLATLSPYYYHFLQGYNYRESCYQCKYAKSTRVSDITLCDFWGIENEIPSMNNYDGVSGVLVNTDKGRYLWDSITNDIVYSEVSQESIINNNGQLRSPAIRPKERDYYYTQMADMCFDVIAQKYTPKKVLIIDSIKDIIPNRYRKRIKYALRRDLKQFPK